MTSHQPRSHIWALYTQLRAMHSLRWLFSGELASWRFAPGCCFLQPSVTNTSPIKSPCATWQLETGLLGLHATWLKMLNWWSTPISWIHGSLRFRHLWGLTPACAKAAQLPRTRPAPTSELPATCRMPRGQMQAWTLDPMAWMSLGPISIDNFVEQT